MESFRRKSSAQVGSETAVMAARSHTKDTGRAAALRQSAGIDPADCNNRNEQPQPVRRVSLTERTIVGGYL